MPELNRPDVSAEIRARQEAWMAAWIANDRDALERLLAPEFALFVSARPEARVDRAAWLRTAGTEYTCEAFRYDGMQVRDFGDVVVVSSLATQRATAFGQDRSGTFCLTDIWRAGADGAWQVIAALLVARRAGHRERAGAACGHARCSPRLGRPAFRPPTTNRAAPSLMTPAEFSIRVRPAVAPDAYEIARLLTELGHPTDAAGTAARWDEWATSSNAALVVPAPQGWLAGLLTVHQMTVLHRPKPVGRITALVVDARVRGQGIGRALVAAAEELFAGAGCGIVEVTSNERLVDAHAFYERLGYRRTSTRFAKTLAESPA